MGARHFFYFSPRFFFARFPFFCHLSNVYVVLVVSSTMALHCLLCLRVLHNDVHVLSIIVGVVVWLPQQSLYLCRIEESVRTLVGCRRVERAVRCEKRPCTDSSILYFRVNTRTVCGRFLRPGGIWTDHTGVRFALFAAQLFSFLLLQQYSGHPQLLVIYVYQEIYSQIGTNNQKIGSKYMHGSTAVVGPILNPIRNR